jgi:hypothetical protein
MPEIDVDEQLYDYLEMREVMKLSKLEMKNKLDRIVVLCYNEGLNGPLTRAMENLVTGINTRVREEPPYVEPKECPRCEGHGIEEDYEEMGPGGSPSFVTCGLCKGTKINPKYKG